MRKLIEKSFVIAFAGILATVSCTKEAPETQVPTEPKAPVVEELVPMEFTASAATKTYVDADGSTLLWQEGDEIAIFDGYGKREFKIKEGTLSGASVTFTGEVDAKATEFYAVYPYDKAVELNGDKNLVASLAATQTLSGTNTPQGSFVAVAKASSTGALSFANVVAYLKINVENAGKVKTIEVNGTALAGTATFSPAGVLQSTSTELGTVTFRPEGTTFDAGTYYLPVFPGTTAAGSFSVSLNGAEAVSAERTASVAVTLERNKGLEFDKIDSDLKWYYKITDAATLQTFLTGDPGCENGKIAVAELNLSGATITPGTELKGTLNGAGHSIVNWTSTQPLYQSVSGTVKNLTIASSSTLAGPAIATNLLAGGTVKAVTNEAPLTLNAGSLSAVFAVGSIVGSCAGTLENVQNKASVTVSATSSAAVNIGGVCGMLSGNSTFKEVSNSGAVTFANGSSATEISVGGILGMSDGKSVAMTNCQNLAGGNVTNHASSTVRTAIAGISGVIHGGKKTGCSNAAKLFNDGGCIGTNASHMGILMGGIFGVAWTAHTLENCVNSGEIEDASDGCITVMAGGIEGLHCNSNLTLSGASIRNEGTLNLKSTSCSNVRAGGLLGAAVKTNANPTISISGTNKGPITLNSTGTNAYVGGVLGYTNAAPTVGGTNEGSITLKTNGMQALVGGILGYTNNADVKLENCTNEKTGIILIDAAFTSTKECIFGGILGNADGVSIPTISNALNKGNITVNGKSTGAIEIGGIAGNCKGGTLNTKIVNEGNISVGAGGGVVRVGGILGQSWTGQLSIDGSSSEIRNVGNIVVAGEQAGELHIGGIVGRNTGNNSSVNYCINKGSVTVESDMAQTLYIGGIAGIASDKTTSYSGNTNTKSASLAFNGSLSATGTSVRIGGILGHSNTPPVFTDNKNFGDISVAQTSSIYELDLGGLIGGYIDPVGLSYVGNEVDCSMSAPKAANFGAVGGFFGNCGGDNSFVVGAIIRVDINSAADGKNHPGFFGGYRNNKNGGTGTITIGQSDKKAQIVKGSTITNVNSGKVLFNIQSAANITNSAAIGRDAGGINIDNLEFVETNPIEKI